MKKVALFMFLCFLCTLCLNDSPEDSPSAVIHQAAGESLDQSIDHVLVVHFHRVQQCTCCINVGKWAEETIKLYYPEEYESGKIVYMDVCVEENQEMARRYNAYGSSLYINVIRNGSDNIIDAVEVWSHCHDHDTYIEVLNQMLEDALHS